MNQKEHILQAIRKVRKDVVPANGKVVLFGSQARGDAHDNSDWDLLILIDKDKLVPSDYDDFAYPFFELGWQLDAEIHPILYTYKDWEKRRMLLLYKNVQNEGIELCRMWKKAMISYQPNLMKKRWRL